MHMIAAYSTVTYDNYTRVLWWRITSWVIIFPLRLAWVLTATDTQSSEEIYALMGVWGEAGLTNYNDHFGIGERWVVF
ncbi:MAG: DUF6345 domain-containing protein [Deinococcales bacterium]